MNFTQTVYICDCRQQNMHMLQDSLLMHMQPCLPASHARSNGLEQVGDLLANCLQLC